MADDIQAAAPAVSGGPGWLFRGFFDGARQWPASVMAFVTGGSVGAWTLQQVQDADGDRLPVKPIGPRGALTDRHGTITTGGTSQQLVPANTSRNYLSVFNPSGATESIFINFTSVAAPDATSYELVPGATFLMTGPGFVSTEQVNVIAATTSHAFGCKEG